MEGSADFIIISPSYPILGGTINLISHSNLLVHMFVLGPAANF